MHQSHRKLSVARGEAAHLGEELGISLRKRVACRPFAAHLLEDARGGDVLQVVDGLFADGAQEAIHLRVIGDADHGNSGTDRGHL